MTLFKKSKTFGLILFSILLIEGCTFTTTKEKPPAFSESTDSLQTDLNKIVTCQNVNLDGREITTNGKTNSELEVDIVNGQAIPNGENQMIALAKRIAIKLKNGLKDKNEYDDYKVLFVRIEKNGSVTETTSNGKIFKSSEL